MAASHRTYYRICEFGYVITNEKFNVLSRGNIIINPNITLREWDVYAKQEILTRTVQEYESQPTFLMVYDDIVNIFKDIDIVFGHTLDGDARALNDECIRYNLKSIDYDFYNINNIYLRYANTQDNISLEKMLTIFGLSNEGKMHDAEADAYNTMQVLKSMVEQSQKSLEDFLNDYKDLADRTENLVIKSVKTRERQKKQYIEYKAEEQSSTLGDRFASLFEKLEKELEK